MPAAPSKATLERDKLAAEIRKITAEADAAEATAAEAANDLRDHLASHNQARVYPFMNEVSGNTVRQCLGALATWHRRDPGEPITIEFNSPGGSVLDGLALYDAIDQIKQEGGTHITTVARGMAASMGGVLLQAGDHRVVGRNAHMLIHEVSTVEYGKLSEIEDGVAFAKQLSARLLSILAERSTLTVDEIQGRWERKDWWMGAEECVELGFADVIG